MCWFHDGERGNHGTGCWACFVWSGIVIAIERDMEVEGRRSVELFVAFAVSFVDVRYLVRPWLGALRS